MYCFPVYYMKCHCYEVRRKELTQPLTVSTVQLLYNVKAKGGKPDRKPYLMVEEIYTETLSLRTVKIMPRNLNKIVHFVQCTKCSRERGRLQPLCYEHSAPDLAPSLMCWVEICSCSSSVLLPVNIGLLLNSVSVMSSTNI
jgi:hypothetical protein